MSKFFFNGLGSNNSVLCCRRCHDSSGDTQFSDKLSLLKLGRKLFIFCPNCESSEEFNIKTEGGRT